MRIQHPLEVVVVDSMCACHVPREHIELEAKKEVVVNSGSPRISEQSLAVPVGAGPVVGPVVCLGPGISVVVMAVVHTSASQCELGSRLFSLQNRHQLVDVRIATADGFLSLLCHPSTTLFILVVAAWTLHMAGGKSLLSHVAL